MAWSTPRTWAVNEVLTVANMNTYIDQREWFTSWNLSPLIFGTFGPGGGGGATYLKLNDATLGQLNNNRLGF